MSARHRPNRPPSSPRRSHSPESCTAAAAASAAISPPTNQPTGDGLPFAVGAGALGAGCPVINLKNKYIPLLGYKKVAMFYHDQTHRANCAGCQPQRSCLCKGCCRWQYSPPSRASGQKPCCGRGRYPLYKKLKCGKCSSLYWPAPRAKAGSKTGPQQKNETVPLYRMPNPNYKKLKKTGFCRFFQPKYCNCHLQML